MTDLRAYARGRECQVRIPGVCNHDPCTVVLAHLRLIGISAMSKKSPDILGAWCCSACHEYCDTNHDEKTKLWFAEGVFRTIYLLVKETIISWG